MWNLQATLKELKDMSGSLTKTHAATVGVGDRSVKAVENLTKEMRRVADK